MPAHLSPIESLVITVCQPIMLYSFIFVGITKCQSVT